MIDTFRKHLRVLEDVGVRVPTTRKINNFA